MDQILAWNCCVGSCEKRLCFWSGLEVSRCVWKNPFLVVLRGVKLKISQLKLVGFLLEFDEMELGKGTKGTESG